MPGLKISAMAAAAFCVAVAGCRPPQPKLTQRELPVYVNGTVAQHAMYVGSAHIVVQGYGMLLGLGDKGSSEAPEHVRYLLTEYLQTHRLGWYRHGTAHLHPARILRDPDTAAVHLIGAMPYGAPEGTRFDVEVSALAQTQTRSLDGGRLLPFPLHLEMTTARGPGRRSHPWAKVSGEVFISPFVDPAKPAQRVKLREGKIIGGGVITKPRPVRLVLAQSSHSRCRAMERAINQRFRDRRGRAVAVAKSATTIEVRIPEVHSKDYRHFLALVLHLPLERSLAAGERRTRDILSAMEQVGAAYSELSLVLEATGAQVLPMIQPYYSSPDAHVAFFTARAGMRLGDMTAGQTLMRIARMGGSPLQIRAIETIGRHSELTGAISLLRELVDGDGELVRVAAYEALVGLGDSVTVHRTNVGGRFTLDVVRSAGKNVIYATQATEARIVLFGRGMEVNRPAFFTTSDALVTMSSVEVDGQDKLMVMRKTPRAGLSSDPFHIDFKVESLIRTLGSTTEAGPDGNIQGLSLTYSQVLRVLHGLCKSEGVAARFVLQRPEQLRRIYKGVDTAGRPDAPE